MEKCDDKRFDNFRTVFLSKTRKTDKDVIHEIQENYDEEEEESDQNLYFDNFVDDVKYDSNKANSNIYDPLSNNYSIIPFNINTESQLKTDEFGNIIPTDNSSDYSYEEDISSIENDINEITSGIQSISYLISLMIDNKITVSKTLMSYDETSEEFVLITESASILTFLGYMNIYNMRRNQLIRILEHLKEKLNMLKNR